MTGCATTATWSGTSSLHIQDWAARLTNLDGTPLAAASRGRAVSAVRSLYRHCEEDLGAARWNLPPRRALAGPTPPAERERYTRFQMDALRTVADRYRGPHAERTGDEARVGPHHDPVLRVAASTVRRDHHLPAARRTSRHRAKTGTGRSRRAPHETGTPIVAPLT
ncbi:hypothetical protein [Streptomyces sp. NPDC004721]